MDSNDFQQPANGSMPTDQNANQPMPNKSKNQQGQMDEQQMGGQTMNGQSNPQMMNGQPMGPNQPMNNAMPMGQPYPQPMMKPPKQPMDPAKKKKLILGLSIGGAVLVLGIAAAIIVPILLRVDYGPAYKVAKELKNDIYDIYQDYDCEYVVDYLESTYTTVKTYNDYIEGCKETMKRSDLVDQLANTEGVKRNSEIQAKFNDFQTLYDSVIPNQEDLEKKLNAYKARHEFVITMDDVSYSSSDAEITAAANILINSGDDALKTYGEGWVEKYLAAAHAYQDFYNTPGWDSGKYAIKNNADTERKNWVSANKPDIKSLYPLNVENTSKLYSEYNKLYDLISDTYEKNYNSNSGDCVEFLGEVVCD